MMLQRLISLFLMLYCLSGIAQTKHVVLETTFGERMICQFSENPKLVHNDKTVTLTTTRVTITYQASEITKVYIDGDSSSGISGTSVEKGKLTLSDDAIYLSGLSASEQVRVYTTNGKLISSHKTTENGDLILSLSNLPKGLYIIKTKNQSFKITRK